MRGRVRGYKDVPHGHLTSPIDSAAAAAVAAAAHTLTLAPTSLSRIATLFNCRRLTDRMNLYRSMCYLLSCQVVLFTLLSSQVSAQGLGILAEVTAVLGVLPVSQLLLAGAGLISLKLAFLVKLLTLLGVIPERKVPLLTGEPEGEIAPSVFNRPPAITPASINPPSQPGDEFITNSPITSTSRPFGMPAGAQSPSKPEDESKSPKSQVDSSPPVPSRDETEVTPQEAGESDFTVVRVVQVPQASLTNESGHVQMILNQTDLPLPVLLMTLQDSAGII